GGWFAVIEPSRPCGGRIGGGEMSCLRPAIRPPHLRNGAACIGWRASVSKSRSFHDRHFRRQQQTAPSGEGAPAGRTCVEEARLDQGQGASVQRLWRDARDRTRERLAYRVRGGGVPQYRRVLG